MKPMDPWQGIALGAASFLQGYGQAKEKARDRELEEKKLKELVNKSRREEDEQGYTRGEDDSIKVNPEFYTEGTPSYLRATRAAALKAQASPRSIVAAAPFTIGEAFATRGIPLPKELEARANDPWDHRLNSLFAPMAKQTEKAPIEMLSDPKGFAAKNPGYQVAAPFAGSFRQQNTPPTRQPMTPDQQRAYERLLGLPEGAAANMTVGQFGSGVQYVRGQEAQGERQNKGIAASENRQNKSLEQSEQHFNESKNLERAKATKSDAAKMEAQISSLGRLGDYIDAAEKMKMNNPDYLKLVAKTKVGNIAGFFGSNAGQLSPEEEERLGKYNEIGGGFVKNMFETGGKQLTGIEKQLVQRYEINPGDSAQQIRAKGRGITDYLESSFEAQASAIERVNPEAAGELRLKAAEVIKNVRQKFKNASDLRADSKGVSVNGAKIPQKKIEQIRQFPTKGTAAAPKDGAVKEVGGVKYKRTGGKWVEMLPGEAE